MMTGPLRSLKNADPARNTKRLDWLPGREGERRNGDATLL